MQVKPVLIKKEPLDLDFLGDDGKKAIRSCLEYMNSKREEKNRISELDNYIYHGGPKPKWFDDVFER